jgi:GntR family transcriptional regulator / MocR family aminotransferase
LDPAKLWPVLELAFRPDRRRPEPVYRQLAGYLRELVAAGRLGEGQKLPATRELALALGLSRNTVNLAYEALVSERLVRAHVGQGTFVAAPRRARSAGEAPGGARVARLAFEGLFAARPSVRFPAADAAPEAPRFDLRPGRVDLASLPRAELKRAFARAIDEALPRLANRLDPHGWPPLREAIARGLVARGMACRAEDVLIVQGAQEGLDLLARILLDPGDAAAVEEPGWFGARLAFASRGAHIVPVAVDGEGLCTGALARVLRGRRVKLVYATPAVQSPTGVVLSDTRRRELLALAEEHQCAIVEDDYESELRLAGQTPPALAQDDAGGRVLYLGTFSKALFPALRMGYLVAAPPVLRRAAEALGAAHFGGNLLAQAALAELLASGALERHVRRVRRLYAERLEALLAGLAAHFPEGTRFARPAGGTIWVELPAGTDTKALAHEARAAGIAFSLGDVAFHEASERRCLSLSFTSLAPDAIREAVAQLGALAHAARPSGGNA